ncbi:MFS transporter [Levilactobacillus brevis]|uniref:MFS transporter n=1 Tax=Levilactobacillus brevis TaxID=1580 RepID=UPI000A26A741|nr:MFS transporter [Levilactobacillus brevis]
MTEEKNITTGYDVTGKKYPRILLILSVLIGGFMTVLTETLLNNGLPTIARNLHVTTATVQWLSTGYLLVIGIMVPVSALLLYRFDSKRLYLTALTIFLVGSLLAYLHCAQL